MTILILGGKDDDHAGHMLDHLRQQGADVEMLDSRWFPTTLTLSHDPLHATWTIRLPSGRVLLPGQVRSVYWRCYNGIVPPALPDPEQAYIAANDARSLFESFLLTLPARWINGWAGYQMHQTKPAALARVAALGIPIPATLSSNDPHHVRAFASQMAHTIFKPVQGGAHTRRVAAQHLTEENLKNLNYAPVTLQEEVPGTNIRAFVAGDRVLACEVRAATLDFRDTDDPEIVVHALPAEVETMARTAAEALHLVWTGIDFRLTPTGRYVFLEANPSPMFLGFEARCALPLTESLAALLIG